MQENNPPSASPNTAIRETLFGDMPIEKWTGNNSPAEPWASFSRAKKHIDAGQTTEAVQALISILQQRDLESRHYLQAHHFLLQLGKMLDEPKELFGVIIEVGLAEGLDILEAYTDYSARYFNYSGAGVVWEHPNDSVDLEIKNVLDRGREVMLKIGPWTEARPPAPKTGNVRLNMLTSQGLHFGEAGLQVMTNDPMGGGLLNAGVQLMQRLTTIQP